MDIKFMTTNVTQIDLLTLKEQLVQIEQKAEHLKGLIEILSNRIEKIKKEETFYNTNCEVTYQEYNPDWTISKKAKYILWKINRPLKTTEFIEIMEKLSDPITKDKETFKRSISALLHVAKKHNRLYTHKFTGAKTLYYALPEWITPAGEVKDTYLNKILLYV